MTIDDALEVLCDVLVSRVKRTLDARLETVLAQRVATAAIKLAPAPPATAKLDKPETLDDEILRIEIIKARAKGEMKRWSKLVAVKKKRDQAANSVEFNSKDE